MLYGRYRYKNEQLHEKHRWDLTVETELWEKGGLGGGGVSIVHSHVSGTAVSQNPVTSASCVEQPAPSHPVHAPRPTPHNTYIDSHGWMLTLYKIDNCMCVYTLKRKKALGEGGGEEYNDR